MAAIPGWNKFLTTLAAHLTKDNVKTVKFLYRGIIPGGEAENIKDGMSLLEQLERREIFSLNDLSQLREILETIPRKDIIHLLDDYEHSQPVGKKGSQKSKKSATEDIESPKEEKPKKKDVDKSSLKPGTAKTAQPTKKNKLLLLSPSHFLSSSPNIAKKGPTTNEETQFFAQSQEYSDEEEEVEEEEKAEEKGNERGADEIMFDKRKGPFESESSMISPPPMTPPPSYNKIMNSAGGASEMTFGGKSNNFNQSSLCDGCHQNVCVCREQNITVQIDESEDASDLKKGEDLQKASSSGRMTLTRPSIYDISEKNCGKCIIFNIEKFNKVRVDGVVLDDREGTNKDAEELRQVFTWLGFHVETFENSNGQELRANLKDISKMDHTPYDTFVCCILSHGYEGGVYCSDGDKVQVTEIQMMFEENPSLVSKPKIFFIQACQGKKDAIPIQVMQADSPIMPRKNSGGNEKAPIVKKKFAILDNAIVMPSKSDFLIAMATTPGNVAWRSATTGSWYIQTLCAIMKAYAMEWDLLEILTKINSELTKKCQQLHDGSVAMQIANIIMNTLTKKVFLKPSTQNFAQAKKTFIEADSSNSSEP